MPWLDRRPGGVSAQHGLPQGSQLEHKPPLPTACWSADCRFPLGCRRLRWPCSLLAGNPRCRGRGHALRNAVLCFRCLCVRSPLRGADSRLRATACRFLVSVLEGSTFRDSSFLPGRLWLAGRLLSKFPFVSREAAYQEEMLKFTKCFSRNFVMITFLFRFIQMTKY